MYEASNNTMENYNTMEQIISDYELSATDILDYLTDYHGMDLLCKDFMENLIDSEL